MKRVLLFICALLFSTNLFASGSALLIEPLYGFEKYYRVTPAPAKFSTRAMLGARATYGVPHLSAELEVTQGSETETFSTESIKDDRQQARLGIRSLWGHQGIISFFFRLGARARKDTRETTVIATGVKTKVEGDIEVEPYLGTGLRITLGKNFALNAGVTGSQVDDGAGGKKLELQTALSGSVGIGSF